MAEIKSNGTADRYLRELGQKLGRPLSLKVGFLEKATYPDGTPVALIAAIQNYGAPSRGIPPRPFFSSAVAEHQDEWAPALAQLLQAGGHDSEKALRLLGEMIKGHIQQSIRDTNDPPLAAATIARKGFSKPLIDTTQMINSVDYAVTG